MEKRILFAFIFNTMLIFNMGLITAANATSDYDNCKRDITIKYTFNYETNETYKEILAAKNAEAEEEYNKWLEETNTTEKKGNCSGTGIPYTTYTCTAGQKNRDCVPQACWSLHDKRDSVFIEQDAKTKFIDAEIEKACGEPPTNTTSADATSDTTSESAEQSQSDNKNAQKEARKEQKKSTKEAECKAKNPPQDVKQNALGMWVCTDSQETINARETAKQNNANLKNFWDDMDDLEKAFTKRIRQLNKSGGAK